jgi:hypothetical protein
MDLNLFATQLNEGIMGEIYYRAKELRALKNSGNEIVSKIAQEFQKDPKAIEKLFLPYAIKDLADNPEIDDKRFEALKTNYRDLFDQRELKTLGKKSFVERLKDRVIGKGHWAQVE